VGDGARSGPGFSAGPFISPNVLSTKNWGLAARDRTDIRIAKRRFRTEAFEAWRAAVRVAA